MNEDHHDEHHVSKTGYIILAIILLIILLPVLVLAATYIFIFVTFCVKMFINYWYAAVPSCIIAYIGLRYLIIKNSKKLDM
jgi:hypothetical protein